MTWVTPRTWVALEKISAAKLQTLRDSLAEIGDPWTAYTPTWSGSTSPAIGNGTLTGAWIQAGKLIHYRIVLTAGSTTTFDTTGWTLTLPTTPLVGFPGAFGTATCYDSSATTIYGRIAVCVGSGTIGLVDTAGARVGSTSPFTWATSDVLTVNGTYEAA